MSSILDFYGQVLSDVDLYGADTASLNAKRDQIVAALKTARRQKTDVVAKVSKMEQKLDNTTNKFTGKLSKAKKHLKELRQIKDPWAQRALRIIGRRGRNLRGVDKVINGLLAYGIKDALNQIRWAMDRIKKIKGSITGGRVLIESMTLPADPPKATDSPAAWQAWINTAQTSIAGNQRKIDTLLAPGTRTSTGSRGLLAADGNLMSELQKLTTGLPTVAGAIEKWATDLKPYLSHIRNVLALIPKKYKDLKLGKGRLLVKKLNKELSPKKRAKIVKGLGQAVKFANAAKGLRQLVRQKATEMLSTVKTKQKEARNAVTKLSAELKDLSDQIDRITHLTEVATPDVSLEQPRERGGSLALYYGQDVPKAPPSGMNPFTMVTQGQWEELDNQDRHRYKLLKGITGPVYWGVVAAAGTWGISLGLGKFFEKVDPGSPIYEHPGGGIFPPAFIPLAGVATMITSAYNTKQNFKALDND